MKPDQYPIPNCSLILDNGQPCRAPARRGDLFCRHHTPEARARLRQAESGDAASEPGRASAPSADGEISPWVLRGYWRMHHRLIPNYDAETLHACFDMILGALADRQIAPTSAGRLLRAILDRRRVLAAEAQQAHFNALLQQSRRGAPPLPARAVPVDTVGVTLSNSTTPLESLTKYPVSSNRAGKQAEIRI